MVKKLLSIRSLVLLLMLWLGAIAVVMAQSNKPISWRQAQRQGAGWYSSQEARRIADNVLLYQNNNGGWLKNIDMADELDGEAVAELKRQKSLKTGTTIDNGATHTQMRYLVKVYQATGQKAYKQAFLKGLDFLLEAQYDNGGWPQYYPIRDGYYEHITYNDHAMIGVMDLLKDIADNKSPYGFVDEKRRNASQVAIDKGLQVILDTQVKVDGKLTVWCAQHDKDDLSPAKARAYELPSLSGGESVGIVRYLMQLDRPSEEVKAAIESAVAWFEASKIEGKKVVRKEDKSLPRGYDNALVDDPEAGPLWGRFYEIETMRPIFVGRDGVIKYKLEEIEHERRVGYSYLSNYAEKLLEREYPEWKSKHSKEK